MRVCNKYMKNPQKILVSKDEIALTQMKQFYTVVNQNGKFGALCDILHDDRVDKAIIFCRTRRETSRLSDQLYRKGYRVQALHAGFTQAQRDRAINDFKAGQTKLARSNRRCCKRLRHRRHNTHNQLRRTKRCTSLLPPHRQNRTQRRRRHSNNLGKLRRNVRLQQHQMLNKNQNRRNQTINNHRTRRRFANPELLLNKVFLCFLFLFLKFSSFCFKVVTRFSASIQNI